MPLNGQLISVASLDPQLANFILIRHKAEDSAPRNGHRPLIISSQIPPARILVQFIQFVAAPILNSNQAQVGVIVPFLTNRSGLADAGPRLLIKRILISPKAIIA
jgi:hypothetical protein